MQSAPTAPPPAPLPNGSNPYDFIMNSGTPKKSFGSGSSMAQRILIVAVGAMLLLIGVIVVFSILTKGGSSASAQLTELAQQQTEIARVADIGVQKATSPATKNFAHITKLSMISGQQQTIAFAAKQGHKINDKQLALKQSNTIDQRLNDAASNNSFDATFVKLLGDQLNSYRQSVLNTYKTSNNIKERSMLQDYFSSVNILIGAKPAA